MRNERNIKNRGLPCYFKESNNGLTSEVCFFNHTFRYLITLLVTTGQIHIQNPVKHLR